MAENAVKEKGEGKVFQLRKQAAKRRWVENKNRRRWYRIASFCTNWQLPHERHRSWRILNLSDSDKRLDKYKPSPSISEVKFPLKLRCRLSIQAKWPRSWKASGSFSFLECWFSCGVASSSPPLSKISLKSNFILFRIYYRMVFHYSIFSAGISFL